MYHFKVLYYLAFVRWRKQMNLGVRPGARAACSIGSGPCHTVTAVKQLIVSDGLHSCQTTKIIKMYLEKKSQK